MEIAKLLEEIYKAFVEEDKFIMKKVVEEFIEDEKFLGDFYNFFIFEKSINSSPLIYSIGGPFDLVSNKAPQQAIVWQDGKVILNTDFTEFVDMRAGAMDALLLQSLDVKNLNGKNVLYFGSGKTASWSMEILKATFPELTNIDFVNSSGKDELLKKRLQGLDLHVTSYTKEKIDISKYDFIFSHTNATQPILNDDDLLRLKTGAVITTFISSTDHGEVTDSFYDDQVANVIMDWDANIALTKDVSRAISANILNKKNIILLKDLFSKTKKLSNSKNYTIARFKGTPMQNLAVVKMLMREAH